MAERQAAPDVTTRLLSVDDVPELTSLVSRNREFLAPWDPVTPDRAFTASGQREVVEGALTRHEQGEMLPHVIVLDGEIVGRINLASITYRAFHSAGMGYWVSQAHNGRGVATAAVGAMLGHAFDALGLHRVQAETLVHNHASQRVLEHNAFERIGYAPAYLRIAGTWQDHVLFQRINPGWVEPGEPGPATR